MAATGQVHDHVRPRLLLPFAAVARDIEALLLPEVLALAQAGLFQQIPDDQLAPVALRLRRPPQRRR